jgi:hypothetical protein
MKVNLTQEEIDSILKQDSEMLAVRVATHRVIGSFPEEAKVAMYELMRRRIVDKSAFNFEAVIEEIAKESKIDLKVPKLQDFKRTFFNELIQAMVTRKTDDLFKAAEQNDEPEEKEPPIPPPMDPKKEKDMFEVYTELKRILEEESKEA